MIRDTASIAGLTCALGALVLSSALAGAGPIRIATGASSAFEGDLLLNDDPGNEFSNDQVGTSTNTVEGPRHVWEEEPKDPGATAITVSSPTGRFYYGGKMGILPPDPAGGEPYAFGTDLQVWNAFGVPENWQNHIAGVGYDTDGVSGAFPDGSTPPEDGFIGLDYEITLEPGASAHVVSVSHPYGATPLCAADANCDTVVDPLDVGYVLARLGCDVGTGVPGCDPADVNLDGVVNPLDIGYILARFGPC